jgi:hypothetical protein
MCNCDIVKKSECFCGVYLVANLFLTSIFEMKDWQLEYGNKDDSIITVLKTI